MIHSFMLHEFLLLLTAGSDSTVHALFLILSSFYMNTLQRKNTEGKKGQLRFNKCIIIHPHHYFRKLVFVWMKNFPVEAPRKGGEIIQYIGHLALLLVKIDKHC